ncbi:hypothetical protein [Pseudoduganella sp. HUAS MS19]
MHTYVGATLTVCLTLALFYATRAAANRFRLPNLFAWRGLNAANVAVGAAFGSYTHIVFDSIMHSDIRPFAPFSDANPLWRIIPLDALHWSCVVAGAIGVAILILRKMRRASA